MDYVTKIVIAYLCVLPIAQPGSAALTDAGPLGRHSNGLPWGPPYVLTRYCSLDTFSFID